MSEKRRIFAATGMTLAAVLTLSACGGGGSEGDGDSSGGRNANSAFSVSSDGEGRVSEVYMHDDGIDISDLSNPETAPSVRVVPPAGWEYAESYWGDDVSPGVVKAVLVNPDAVAPNGLEPRIYISIARVPDDVDVKEIQVEDVAHLPGLSVSQSGKIKMGKSSGQYASGVWEAPSGYSGHVIGTTATTVMKSGGQDWLITVVAEKADDGDDGWWQADLEDFTSSMKYRKADG